MRKGAFAFGICMAFIIIIMIVAIVWFPNRNIGEIRNVYQLVEIESSIAPTVATLPPIEMIETSPVLPGEVVEESCVNWYSDYRVYPTGKITTTAGGEEFDIDFLAKLLYCEAGGINWEGQVYTCSAILNFCDVEGRSLWEAGHDRTCFEPAPYVDRAVPTTMQYEVIEWVLGGGRIEEISYFRSGGKYHNFGTPVCEVDGHYFSK